MRILVVEDERKVAADLARALQGGGHIVEQVGDGEKAWFLGDTEDYDLVVLDLGLPKLEGLQVLKRWRANNRTMPVLVLTARDSWSDKVEAIDIGADDYLTKPFRMEELLARVRALLRRQTQHASAVLAVGDLALDTRHSRVSKAGLPVELSLLEPPAAVPDAPRRPGCFADRADRARVRAGFRARQQCHRGSGRAPQAKARR